jgi:hypothetical protein
MSQNQVHFLDRGGLVGAWCLVAGLGLGPEYGVAVCRPGPSALRGAKWEKTSLSLQLTN